ncbi:matrixin family metalloprotease [Candidatus Gracilibacteria bacterium]|nr:matrixin family metalloprotease [Candidatus Gracilibacteria bacterium]MCF7898633.1 matrixin family metalloprotease [Candidatus Paceibacterota bacterium]
MSNVLLKIYGFLIIITLLFSSIFIYTKNYKTNKVDLPIDYVSTGAEADEIGIILPASVLVSNISTSTTKDSIEFKKITESIQPEKVIESSGPVSDNSKATVIDILETDTRAISLIPNPCASPIIYTLGEFDTRFNISKSYFLSKLNEAASLWNEASGRKLFEYSPDNNPNYLVIDLVYDERQQKTDQNKLLGAEIDNSKNAAILIQKEYEEQKIIFLRLKEEYTKAVEDFNIRHETYNNNIIYWNEKGGAPRNEYDALMLEKEQLQKESEMLTYKQNILNLLLAEINAKITKYNELVAFSNERVDISNITANKKFTEGNYSPNTNKITIYQFSDEIKLKRVLTHELGHTLGIDHVENSKSIMYAINNDTTTVLSTEDKSELEKVCP